MTLRRKILVGYGAGLGLLAVLLAWSVVNLVSLGQASDAILRENYKSILAAENMIDAIERQDSATLLVALGYHSEGTQQFRENENHFLQWLGRAKDNITIAGEADIISAVEAGYSAYLVSFSRLQEPGRSDPEHASELYHETILPSFQAVRDNCIRLREINQDTMFTASRRAERVAHTAILSTGIVGLAAVAVGLAFSLLLSKRLVQPIRQMMHATEAVAEGDYDVRVPAGGTDELGRLSEGFNAMADRLGAYHRLNVEKILGEKRKSEAVLQSIEDGIVVVDAGLRISDLNPPARRMLDLGVEKGEGRHFLEVVKNEKLFEYVKAAAESLQPPAIEEGKNILTVGEGALARHYMFDVTPVVSKAGGMLGVVLLLRDVTRLKELDRMKSEFVMTASHELKTPLHSLGMSIELLAESASEHLTDRQRQLLSAAHEELQRLKSLIGDLLDLSRLEAGRVEMDIAPVPVHIMTDKAIAVFKAQADEQHVELAATMPEDLLDVQADVNKMTWVLTNLISNALRYVDAGGYIRLTAEHIGRWVHVSVTDDGEGIPPEYQSRIFDKFVQVRSEKSIGGTGLGLAICREIVRAHKGTIWVDSAPGKGSTFTFTLPAAERT